MKSHSPITPPRIEPLEARIAPATVLDGSTVQYLDFDGDLVTVKFSKNIFSGKDADGLPLELDDEANQVFTFDSGLVSTDPDIDTPQQLQRIDLTPGTLTNEPNGAVGIKITVQKGPAGDGLVDIGAIEAERLGAVVVPGDLARIDLLGGSGTTLGSLVVRSMGERGNATLGGMGSLYSLIDGNVGKIEIQGDLEKVRLELSGGNLGSLVIGGSVNGGTAFTTGGTVVIAGSLGSLSVGGSLVGDAFSESGSILVGTTLGSAKIGGSLVGGDGDDSGQLFAGGVINSLSTGGDLLGGLGENSGSALSGTSINKITVNGSLTGGAGDGSGSALANGDINSATVLGFVTGGTGAESGAIRAGDVLGTIKITGSVTGGMGDQSGQIFGGTQIKALSIGGNLAGGDGVDSGAVVSEGRIGSANIAGDLAGGSGDNSGSVVSGDDPDLAGDTKKVTVGGDLLGGDGAGSGAIVSGGELDSVTVKGSLLGGLGDFSASISSAFAMGAVNIKANVTGGGGISSAAILSGSKIGSVTVAGNLAGGAGAGSGSVSSQTLFTPDLDGQGDIGKVTVNGSVAGGTGADSGQIAAAGDLKQALIGGSLAAALGARSGSVFAGLDPVETGLLGKLTVKGSIDGGAFGARIEGQRIGTVQVDGSVQNRVTVAAWDDLSKLLVKGNVAGTASDRVVVSARGQGNPAKTDMAIGTVEITGNASGLDILAGYDPLGNAVNADAQIGKVLVGGNWSAGSVAAGVADTDADGFGDADDAAIAGGDGAILSRIAQIVIGGTVAGSAGPGDHFGFVAQEIASLKIGGVAVALTKGPGNDLADPLAGTDDVAVREIA